MAISDEKDVNDTSVTDDLKDEKMSDFKKSLRSSITEEILEENYKNWLNKYDDPGRRSS